MLLNESELGLFAYVERACETDFWNAMSDLFFFSLSDFVLKIDWSQRAVLGEGNDDNATDNFIRYLLITAIFSLTISLEP